MSTVKPAQDPQDINSVHAVIDASIDEVELNNLSETFDLFTPEGAELITGVSASIQLNRCYKSFQAIDAITRILIADGVAHDCDRPVLAGYLSGGLLIAAGMLSEVAVSGLEDLAESVNKRLDEARHG
ncbi:hypothetical protein [Burkholderia lata]|uniref:hypothetical protein n=1 Tax=Burkholderia lata (strain ATCC 17760 / DSM 23089 / LMG 22485 / NCIMB 9086 / R18194 / 383) TaxID=482957 RepID=UPI0014545ADF|nr:hypothetical protein [Burkholderia lata]VWB67915.1 hypothetical protein BLA15816_03217 [Burkholderia lata]